MQQPAALPALPGRRRPGRRLDSLASPGGRGGRVLQRAGGRRGGGCGECGPRCRPLCARRGCPARGPHPRLARLGRVRPDGAPPAVAPRPPPATRLWRRWRRISQLHPPRDGRGGGLFPAGRHHQAADGQGALVLLVRPAPAGVCEPAPHPAQGVRGRWEPLPAGRGVLGLPASLPPGLGRPPGRTGGSSPFHALARGRGRRGRRGGDRPGARPAGERSSQWRWRHLPGGAQRGGGGRDWWGRTHGCDGRARRGRQGLSAAAVVARSRPDARRDAALPHLTSVTSICPLCMCVCVCLLILFRARRAFFCAPVFGLPLSFFLLDKTRVLFVGARRSVLLVLTPAC